MKGLKRAIVFILIVVAVLVAYFLLWPVPIDPVAWSPQQDPGLTGPYAANNYLADVERLGDDPEDAGPEDIAFDADGNVFGGLEDGRILKCSPEFTEKTVVANTGGRPLGLDFDADGNLIIADGIKGLLRMAPDGSIETLSTEYGGAPFRFVDDADVAPDGTIYFTDASFKFTVGQSREDVTENAPNGRLLGYEPDKDRTFLVEDGFHFPNGVAVAPDGSYLLMNETARYRIFKVWLMGEKKYEAEVLVDNLPGFPDNITSNGEGEYWVALFAPRNEILDRYAGSPMIRKMLFRLPAFMQPAPAHYAMCLCIDAEGNLLHNLQDPEGHYAPITTAREYDGALWLGSLTDTAVGRIALPEN